MKTYTLVYFQRNTDWSEYMEEVGQCIDAMISEAIEKENLDDARKKFNQIAVYLRNVLDEFGNLSPDSVDDNTVDDIDDLLEQGGQFNRRCAIWA